MLAYSWTAAVVLWQLVTLLLLLQLRSSANLDDDDIL